jgi:hypothetical protein
MYTDEQGYKHITLCAEGDDPAEGIHQDPPIVGVIDWHEIERELHNWLVENNMTDWRAVQAAQSTATLSAGVNSVIRPKIIQAFKLSEQGVI